VLPEEEQPVRRGEVATFTTPEERGLANGAFYLAGGGVALLALADPLAARGPVLAIAIGAAIVGVLSILGRRRMTMLAAHAVVALASTLIALAAVYAGGGFGSVILLVDYLLVGVFMALLGSARALAGHTAWAAATMLAACLTLWPAERALPIAGAYLVVMVTVTAVSALLAARLRDSATTDALTGLANRAAFDAALRAAVATVGRTEEPLSVVLLDLDGFKRINDREGHAAGDALLRTAARTWTGLLRERDTLARIGGDEFAVVMPGADRSEAALAAARLTAATPRIGCSAGIATWRDDGDVQRFLADADRPGGAPDVDPRTATSTAGGSPTSSAARSRAALTAFW
jgi:diguanylate cyclase (GGDEF)-like protein